MKEYIAKAVDGKDLTQEEAKKAMDVKRRGNAGTDRSIFNGNAHERRNVRGTHRSGIGAAR